MMNFEEGQRVEFDAKDCVNVGTVIERADAPMINLEVVVVQTDDDEIWAMHPDLLRPVEDNDGTSTI